VVVWHRMSVLRRAELVGGYEAGPTGPANYYGAFPPVYDPVTVTQTIVPRSSLIVPICNKLGCYQMNACVDCWDFQTKYGGCEVYDYWTQEIGCCEVKEDKVLWWTGLYGVRFVCSLHVLPATNAIAVCDGDGQVKVVDLLACRVIHLRDAARRTKTRCENWARRLKKAQCIQQLCMSR